MVDIHSHILPGIDDGAKNVTVSVKLLEMLKKQNVTDVFATPHFYPQTDNAAEFHQKVEYAFSELSIATSKLDLPKVHLGCEMLYFKGIGNSDAIGQFCYENSKHLLLEATDDCINDAFFEDIYKLKSKWGITPIIAHIERYCGARKFDDLIDYVTNNGIMTQINASSFTFKPYLKEINYLIKCNAVTFIGSDAHSVEHRPPKFNEAFSIIESQYGDEYKNKLISNAQNLLNITLSGE